MGTYKIRTIHNSALEKDEQIRTGLAVRLNWALTDSSYAKKRNRVRALAYEAILDMGLEMEVQETMERSPLVGEGGNQIKVSKDARGLAWRLSVNASADLVWCAVMCQDDTPDAWNRIKAALINPATSAKESSSTSSKTGYRFGENKVLTEDWEADVLRSAESLLNRLMGPQLDEAADEAGALEDAEKDRKAKGRAARLSGRSAPAFEEPTKEEETPAPASGTGAKAELPHIPPMPDLKGFEKEVLDLALKGGRWPNSDAIRKCVGQLAVRLGQQLRSEKALEAEVERLKRATVAAPVVVGAKGAHGKGEVTQLKVRDVFDLPGAGGGKMFDFEVPVWKWEGDHPEVPQANPNYVFRPTELLRVLMALVMNERLWLHGHTGTGKTTLVEQVCARLRWPMIRVNFDGEITRTDLVGRDKLKIEKGMSASEFVEGLLPYALSGPNVLVLDELDFVMPDVSYTAQSALEGEGMRLLEDGGRIVRPHAMSRIVATGNTVGQGDEHGMYQGARAQSMAMLDRFTSWVEVEYLGRAQVEELLAKEVPDLKPDQRTKLVSYVEEHTVAFTQGKIMQPLSPRGFLAIARGAVAMERLLGPKEAMLQAVDRTVIARCTAQDRLTLRGVVQRVFG